MLHDLCEKVFQETNGFTNKGECHKMLPAAPTKLDQLIIARTAAEEIDHFRKVARVAGDMGVDVSFVLSQPNEKRFIESFRGLITTLDP